MIEPYYDQDGITIYNADCRKVLPFLERFDLLLTDPPYGIDAGNMNLGGYASSRLERGDWGQRATAEMGNRIGYGGMLSGCYLGR